MLRYGLIGSGMMGQEHITNIDLVADAQITAIADPNDDMRRIAGKMAPDAQQFSDYKDLLSSNLCDVFVLVTPNDTHHAILMDLLPLGKPVLCEKPLCTTSAHCRGVINAAIAPVWVAMEYRYMDPLQELKSELETIGTPRQMSIREHRFPFLDKVDDWNRFSERTGGTLTEKCCHFWDLMRLMLQSNPTRVYASGGADVNHRMGLEESRQANVLDNAYAIVDFECGARGMLDLCMFAEGAQWQEIVTLTGERGRLEARIPGSHLAADKTKLRAELSYADRRSHIETTRIITSDPKILAAGSHHGSTYYQHQKFAEMVRTGGKPEVTLEDGLWSVRVGEAAELSAKTGQPVEL